jgi:hypothetical protein
MQTGGAAPSLMGQHPRMEAGQAVSRAAPFALHSVPQQKNPSAQQSSAGVGQAPLVNGPGSPAHLARQSLSYIFPVDALHTGARILGQAQRLPQHLDSPHSANVCVPSARHPLPQQNSPGGQQSAGSTLQVTSHSFCVLKRLALPLQPPYTNSSHCFVSGL